MFSIVSWLSNKKLRPRLSKIILILYAQLLPLYVTLFMTSLCSMLYVFLKSKLSVCMIFIQYLIIHFFLNNARCFLPNSQYRADKLVEYFLYSFDARGFMKNPTRHWNNQALRLPNSRTIFIIRQCNILKQFHELMKCE